jgi:hypothetical protein
MSDMPPSAGISASWGGVGVGDAGGVAAPDEGVAVAGETRVEPVGGEFVAGTLVAVS